MRYSKDTHFVPIAAYWQPEMFARFIHLMNNRKRKKRKNETDEVLLLEPNIIMDEHWTLNRYTEKCNIWKYIIYVFIFQFFFPFKWLRMHSVYLVVVVVVDDVRLFVDCIKLLVNTLFFWNLFHKTHHPTHFCWDHREKFVL